MLNNNFELDSEIKRKNNLFAQRQLLEEKIKKIDLIYNSIIHDKELILHIKTLSNLNRKCAELFSKNLENWEVYWNDAEKRGKKVSENRKVKKKNEISIVIKEEYRGRLNEASENFLARLQVILKEKTLDSDISEWNLNDFLSVVIYKENYDKQIKLLLENLRSKWEEQVNLIINKITERVYKPTDGELYQQHQRLKKWEDRNFNIKIRIKDFAPHFQKVVERRKKLDEYKDKVKNSFFSFLFNNYVKEQIEQSQTIENIDRISSWNIWEPKTRKAKIIYVGMPFVVLFVWFSNWKWNLIKKYKDWYNDPGYLDGEEENWDWLEEEV